MNRLRQLLPTVLVSVTVAVLVTLLAPPAVQAAGRTYVTLRDPSNNTGAGMANVVGGKLSVTDGAGALTVDGTVTAKPPARVPFTSSGYVEYHDNDSDEVCNELTVPAGKRLVVQSVSAALVVPQRVELPLVLVYAVNGEQRRLHLPKTLDTTVERSSGDYVSTYVSTLTGLDLMVDPGTSPWVSVDRPGQVDVLAGCDATINGYLE